LVELSDNLLWSHTQLPTMPLLHDKIETYREDETGWKMYKCHSGAEDKKAEEPLIDLPG
jgi:hypothetical protein